MRYLWYANIATFVVLYPLVLVDAVKGRQEVRRYLNYGILFALVMLAMHAGVLMGFPFVVEHALGVAALAALPGLLSVLVFGCVGIWCARELGTEGTPVIGRLLGDAELEPSGLNARGVLWTAVLASVAAGYSWAVFACFKPGLSPAYSGLKPHVLHYLGIEVSTLTAVLSSVRFAVSEEVVYRLGIQSYLAKQFRLTGRRYLIAVLITSALWSIGHVPMTEPWWVKVVQVFPLGVGLGFLFRRYGLGACIIVHGVLNAFATLFA